MRLLVLCTHNSARSQMAEGWLQHYAQNLYAQNLPHSLPIDVASAGSQKTFVKPEAVKVMAEVGIDISGHCSKTTDELSDPWDFGVVMTVCDSANETCPVYPGATRLHVSFPDPSGKSLDDWRAVRDALGVCCHRLIDMIRSGAPLDERGLEAPAETSRAGQSA